MTALATAVGLCARSPDCLVDVAAGAAPDRVAVASGTSGHGTGWLGARRVVRSLVDGTPAVFTGAASERDRAEAAKRWMGEHADVTIDLPRDLVDAFTTLDARALAIAMPGGEPLSLAVECVAAILDGARVRGAYAGAGWVAVLRADADRPAELVVPHVLDKSAARSPRFRDLPAADLPANILISALGMLAAGGIGVDRFEVSLGDGDVLLLCTRPLELDDATLVEVIRSSRDLASVARAIEHRTRPETDVAFALVRGSTAASS